MDEEIDDESSPIVTVPGKVSSLLIIIYLTVP
jgi:hypothetical protein